MKQMVYDLNCFPRAITTAEAEALTQMFDGEGWRVWVSMKRIQALASSDIGLSLTADDQDRVMHRAVYHAVISDIAAKDEFNHELSTTDAVDRNDLSVEIVAPPDLGTVRLKTL